MSGKLQFFARGENPKAREGGIVRWLLYEDRLGQVHFARNHLHRFLRKPVAVGDDRQGITFKASGSENVKCVEAAVHGSSDCSPRSCQMSPGLREGPFVNDSTCV